MEHLARSAASFRVNTSNDMTASMRSHSHLYNADEPLGKLLGYLCAPMRSYGLKILCFYFFVCCIGLLKHLAAIQKGVPLRTPPFGRSKLPAGGKLGFANRYARARPSVGRYHHDGDAYCWPSASLGNNPAIP